MQKVITLVLSVVVISTMSLAGVNAASPMGPNRIIAGGVWLDTNRDGINNDGGVGLLGWRVWIDADLDRQYDASELSTLTQDLSGRFQFDQFITNDVFYVCQMPATPLWRQTFPRAGLGAAVFGSAVNPCYYFNLNTPSGGEEDRANFFGVVPNVLPVK